MNSLLILERHVLRRMHGPVQAKKLWRIRNNKELEKLRRRELVFKCVRAQRVKCLGHLNEMGNKNTQKDY